MVCADFVSNIPFDVQAVPLFTVECRLVITVGLLVGVCLVQLNMTGTTCS